MKTNYGWLGFLCNYCNLLCLLTKAEQLRKGIKQHSYQAFTTDMSFQILTSRNMCTQGPRGGGGKGGYLTKF